MIVATIPADDPRAQNWLDVFGALSVPVRERSPVVARCRGEVFWAYFVAVERLDEGQKLRVVDHVARGMELPVERVLLDLLGPHGLPLKADGLSISERV